MPKAERVSWEECKGSMLAELVCSSTTVTNDVAMRNEEQGNEAESKNVKIVFSNHMFHIGS